MISFPRAVYDSMIAHFKSEMPHEGCGLVSGRGGKVLKFHPIANEESSPVCYRMDSTQQIRAFREMEKESHEFLGICHSHPTSEAYPSETDRSLAFFDEVFYLIVSLKNEPVARVFWLREGKIQEDKLNCSG